MADGSHFVKRFPKNKVAYRSEMARNAIESEFRTSKMADGSHYVKNVKKLNNSAGSHFVKKNHTKIKLWYWSEMVRSDFWTSKMASGGRFLKNIYKKSCASDLNNVRTNCWPTTTWYKFTFGQYIHRHVCWERGNIHCVRPLGRMHTILVNKWSRYYYCYC